MLSKIVSKNYFFSIFYCLKSVCVVVRG
uniref:Uncharacterized protein n=1 Tax=Ciona intestinalis TaxID=7719 RepID=H2XST9_CIOIN